MTVAQLNHNLDLAEQSGALTKGDAEEIRRELRRRQKALVKRNEVLEKVTGLSQTYKLKTHKRA